MLSDLFNYDNPVWRFIGKFWDVLIINLLWVVCSIPVFTIGASTTAMYYVMLRLTKDDDGYTIRLFFKSFKENFKQATVIWLVFLFTGALLAFDIYYFVKMFPLSSFRTMMLTIFFAMTFIWTAMFTYVFPLQSRFYNPVKRTIFNSFFMSIRHMFSTLGMLAMDGIIVFLALGYVPQITIFGVALIAFFNSYLLNNIFKIYIPEEEKAADMELQPLFADEEEKQQDAEISS